MVYNKTSADPPRPTVAYAAVSLTVSGGAVDYSLKENSTLFDKVTVGREVVVRNTLPILLKMNNVDNDAVELYSYEGISTSGVPVTDLFITTTASGSNIRAWILGWN